MRTTMVWVMFLLCGAAAMAAAIQDPAATVQGFNYVAWDVDDSNSIVTATTSKAYWKIAQESSGPQGVYADSVNYYGSGYLFAVEKSYNTVGTNYYSISITFTAAGDYSLFMRVAGFDGAGTVSNGDSIYMAPDVGGFMVSGADATDQIAGSGFERENGTSGLSDHWEWYHINRHIQVTPEQLVLTGQYVFELKVASREGGFALDRMMAIAAEGFDPVTSADLDALVLKFKQPWGENPINGSTNAALSPALSWNGHVDPNLPDLLNSSVKRYYVYVSETPGGALSLAGQVNVSGTNPAASFAVTGPLDYLSTYSWQIEEGLANGQGGIYGAGDPNNILGPVWSFTTMPQNFAPAVSAGEDIQSWVQPGGTTVQLAGVIVEDDAYPQAATVAWTIVSQPDELNPAVLNNASALDATVTLQALGTYTLRLTADDTELQASDDVTIVLHPDACTAAKATPGFMLLTGDLNENCVVDLDDFAVMAANWLQYNYLE